VTFFAPQSYLNTDGVLMRLNTSKSETRTYKNSLFEILYPEVWNTAYSLATKSAEAESTKNYLSLQNSSDASITQLQSQISLINQQLKKLNSQLKKICSAKKKPTGC
jgi:septal ring factor EnvC (AmiA/AmiB activator)